MLNHEKQSNTYGCIYHALYAVTGIKDLLTNIEDLSTIRSQIRMVKLGFLPFTHCNTYPKVDVSPAVFNFLLENNKTVIITIASQNIPNSWHDVALSFNKGKNTVTVSDSNYHFLQLFNFYDFMASFYAHACCITEYFKADLSYHKCEVVTPKFRSNHAKTQ